MENKCSRNENTEMVEWHGNTLRDSTWNKSIHGKLEVLLIQDETRESIEMVWACAMQANKCAN